MCLQLSLLFALCGLVYSYNPNDICYDIAREGSALIYHEHCKELLQLKNPDGFFQCIERHGYPFYNIAQQCMKKFWPDSVGKLKTTGEFLNKACSDKPEESEDAFNLVCCIVSREVAMRNETGAYKVDTARTCLSIQRLENNFKEDCSV